MEEERKEGEGRGEKKAENEETHFSSVLLLLSVVIKVCRGPCQLRVWVGEIKSCLHIEKRKVPNVFTAEKPSLVGSNGSSEDPLRYRRLVNRLLQPALPSPSRPLSGHTHVTVCMCLGVRGSAGRGLGQRQGPLVGASPVHVSVRLSLIKTGTENQHTRAGAILSLVS